MKDKKLAVVFPGIGYHRDKPLLYFSTKLAVNMGYEPLFIEYHDMPLKIRGNAEMMKKAAELACEQSSLKLSGTDLSVYDDILFIGKSIGTIALAKYAADHKIDAGQIWYTPLEATFSFGAGDVIAFIGDDDPWSDVGKVKRIASDKQIRLYSYPGCNHSLERGDVDRDISHLRDIMLKTDDFIKSHVNDRKA